MKTVNTEEKTTSGQQGTSSENENKDKLHYGGEGKSEKLFERFRIEGTPWRGVWEAEKGWSAGIAEQKITDWYETKEELLEVLKGADRAQIDWNLMFGFVDVIVQKVLQFEKLTEAEKNRKEAENEA